MIRWEGVLSEHQEWVTSIKVMNFENLSIHAPGKKWNTLCPMNDTLNLWAGWIGILGGVASGMGMGLVFHRENWLGGYGSYPRRMLRLGHISFFGLGFLNLMFDQTVLRTSWAGQGMALASVMLIIGAITMPTVCLLSAWKKPLRHLFFIPVIAILTGVSVTLMKGVLS